MTWIPVIMTPHRHQYPDVIRIGGETIRVRRGPKHPRSTQRYWRKLSRADVAEHKRQKYAGKWISKERAEEIYGFSAYNTEDAVVERERLEFGCRLRDIS